MTLARLHAMLLMLGGATGTGGGSIGFDMSPVQLRGFLGGLVESGKIECIEGVYALAQAQVQGQGTGVGTGMGTGAGQAQVQTVDNSGSGGGGGASVPMSEGST
jgi:hypothetical protein